MNSNRKSCPTWNGLLATDGFEALIIKNQISRFILKCVHHNEIKNDLKRKNIIENTSCCWTGEACQLQQHLNNECCYEKTNCKNIGCEQEFLRKDLDIHKVECNYRKIACDFCNKKMIYKSFID